AGSANPDGSMSQPVIALDTGTPTDRTVSQSRSFTYLRPNGDGTFGLVSETHETIAPVTIAKGMAGGTTIEFLGEWVLRAVAAGDGTSASGAVDVVQVGLVDPNAPIADVHLADLRIGHMETVAKVPAGGIDCPIPVKKTANPDPVNAGQDFTWTISIPTDAT